MVGYLSIDRIATPAGAHEDVPGGAALYAALGARALGAEAVLHAAAGHDWRASWIARLAALGIDVAPVERRESPARRARLRYRADGARDSAHYSEPVWWELTDRLAPPPPRFVAPGDVVIAGPMRASDLAATIAAAGGAATVADTAEPFAGAHAAALMALLPRLAVFAPSVAETRLLCPGLADDDAVRALAGAGCRVVQKRGARGLALDQGREAPLAIAAPATVLVDPTGAGDAAVGALGAALAGGSSLVEAAERAVRIGARAAGGIGPAALGFAWDR